MLLGDSSSSEVSIVGLGPWGLCALERIVDAARRSAVPVVVHVVEPGRPGGGMYAYDHPDYMVLNTPCGQHSMYPFPEQLEQGRLGLGFYEWAAERGYKWQGWHCQPGPKGVPISRHDFLPRRVMGEYLEWFYEVLCAEAPAQVSIQHHRTTALDIEPEGELERVYLADGTQLLVDNVVLTTGHISPAAAQGVMGALSTRPYPIEPYLDTTGPHEKVAIEGMGLVALDVVTALTTGLGGTFSEEPGGKLRYRPSGREPLIYMFSRSGYPYCAKSFGAADPMGDYEPAICTTQAVAHLRRTGPDGRRRQLDARRELLPLVFAEMELRYFTCSAHMEGGAEAARGVHERLVSAWAAGTWGQERARAAGRYGDFDAASHFFVGQGRHYVNDHDYQAQVYAEVESDTREALVGGGASPVKAALETLRALRDTVRLAVEFKGLTLSSHLDFTANIQSRFARLVAGPPVFRSQQLMALMDAGILQAPFGPSPEVLPQIDGSFRVRSTQLQQQHEVVLDRLVRAHLDLPSVGRAGSPLLVNLARRGRARPLQFNGTAVGSIDISEDFHPVARNGQAQPRLWVFGVLTEGARYFTLYIPSPKSRVRAFVDAEVCARAVTGAPTPGVAGMTARGGVARVPALHILPRDAYDIAAGHAAGEGLRTVRIALVNNMPDGAFEETDRQFLSMVSGGFAPGTVTLERYSLPGIIRGPHAVGLLARNYAQMTELYANPPDALIVTGAEPKKADLAEEFYWPALERLLRWSRDAVPSALVSCLSAHALLWSFDRLTRRLLLEKCSGVFAQEVDEEHPLMAGVSRFAVPHSRFNEIPLDEVAAAGYQVVSRSVDGDWTVAVGEKGSCQFTMLQGHPEYQPLTLLREYRRDVRCYLLGNQGSYPHVPTGYLGPEGMEAVARFHNDVSWRQRDPVFMNAFPFDEAAKDVRADWEQPARALMGNWLQSVRQRAGLRSYIETGA